MNNGPSNRMRFKINRKLRSTIQILMTIFNYKKSNTIIKKMKNTSKMENNKKMFKIWLFLLNHTKNNKNNLKKQTKNIINK